MKVLILGNKSTPHQCGVLIYLEARAQGRDVEFVHYDGRSAEDIWADVERINPDWLFITGMRSIRDPALFTKLCVNYKVLLWDADALGGQRAAGWTQRGPQAAISVNSTLHVKETFDRRFRIEWLPQFYDAQFYKPTFARLDPSHPIYDICFLGDSDREPQRQDILRRLKAAGFKCCFRGSHAALDQKRDYVYGQPMADIYRQSKIAVDIKRQHFTYGKCTTSDRIYKAMGCGAMCLTYEIPAIERLFRPGEEMVMYSDYEDLAAKIHYYLEHEAEREIIASAGAKAVAEKHTLTIRLAEYWALMENG